MANESTNGYSFIEKINWIVDANLDNDKFNISSLAQESGLSKITLYRKIKAETGKTVSQYIRDIRLEKASDLLLHDNLTVSEIAYNVGFSSATYFNKCFHAKFGSSPGEFRKTKQYKQTNLQPNTTHSNLLKIASVIMPLFLLGGILYMLYDETAENTKNIPIIVRSSIFFGNQENEIYSVVANKVIINELSSIEGFSIYDQKIIEEFISKKGSEIELYEKNPDAYLFTSSTHEEQDFWIISWQISSLKNGKILISRKDTTKKGQILATGKHIAYNIATEFKAPISGELEQKWKKQENPTAAYFYIQAFKILYGNEIKRNRDLYNTAEQLLYKAIEADSTYYKPYEELAFLLTNKSYWRDIHTETFQDSSLYYVNKALRLNKKSYKAHHMRASYFFHRNKITEALKELDICTKLNPSYLHAYELKGRIYRYYDLAKCIENYHKAAQLSCEILPYIHRQLSFHYASAGCFEESKIYAQKAYELDNNSMMLQMSLAGYETANGNREKGIEYFLEAYKQNPENSNLLLLLGKAYSDKNDFKLAAKYFDEYIEFLKKRNALDGLGVVHRPAFAYWQLGEKEKADYYFDLQIKNTMKDLDLERPFHQYRVVDVAEVYAVRGDKENAYKYLEFILAQPVCVPFWLNDIVQNDPQFNLLRNEPRFKKLAKQYQKGFESEHKNVKKWIANNQRKYN